MNDFAVKAENIGKQYLIGAAEQRHDSFREMLLSVFTSPFKKFRRLSGSDQAQERFWALEGLNFEIKAGEKVGVIGHNGAGKSTLLKVLSRITPPTTGQIKIRGRVSSLLEVGTGFHPELTGRENIFLNGSILGMSREQIRARFDEIVAFAEVERFIDTPVKRYSSGMYVRLAFSVAAHLESDVLIVDEVLAVGDQRFQDKALGKLDDLGENGRTVLFVSHNLSMINRLCTKAMFLENGKLMGFGDAPEISSLYAKSRFNGQEDGLKGLTGPLSSSVEFLSLSVNGNVNAPETVVAATQELNISLKYQLKRDLKEGVTTLSLVKNGQTIVSQHDTFLPNHMQAGDYVVDFSFESKFLSPGRYAVTIGVADQTTGQWVWGNEQAYFVIPEIWLPDYQPSGNMGVVNHRTLATRNLL